MKGWFFLSLLLASTMLLAVEPKPQVEGYLTQLNVAGLRAEFSATPDGKEAKKVSLLAGDAAIGWQNRKIKCSLEESDGKIWAENIFSAEPEELRQSAEVTESLKRDTFERGRIVTRLANELMPIMALWGQDGKFYLKKDFLGNPVVLNFIFTRCGNPKMCPASTKCMKQLGDSLDADLKLKDVKLITISFDPQYDSPGVLRMYADAYKTNPKRHTFLTGDTNQIKDLMRHYGILTTQADGTIVHNSAVIVISPEGRIIQRREGAIFDIEDMLVTLKDLTDLTVKQ